jgi:hypothetical protein
MMRFVLVSLVVCLTAFPRSAAAERRFIPGQRLVDVASESVPGQRFTVYVPKGFDSAKPTPILYLLDPRRRAEVPVKLFQAAADRFGYVLISSHNTQSDSPMEPNLHAVQAMWDDSHQWFNVDPRRTYLAGFSGTARTASLLARHRPGSFTGIIGAAAGFHPDVRAAVGTQFLYFGTVSDGDYNFHEVEMLEQSLVSANSAHRIARFAGPHAWMPQPLATEAVEWLELRAMQSGARARDEALLNAWWARDEAAARAAEESGAVLDSARRYAAMVRDYAGLRDVTAIAATSARLNKSRDVDDAIKKRRAAATAAKQWIDTSMEVIAESFNPGENLPVRTIPQIVQALDIAKLRKGAAQQGTPGALEAQRRLNELEVQLGFYLPHEAMGLGELTRASYYLTVSMEINEKSPVAWYLSAAVSARLGNTGPALESLRRAADEGFKDVAGLRADAAFQKLRSHRDYLAIVDRLAATSDDLDVLTVERPPSLR